MTRGATFPSDEALVHNARSGDERAFLQLVKRHEQTVFSFAFKVCRDKEKAAETVQDTFVNVHRKLGQFRGRSKFSTWLYSIVSNNCLMKHRRGKRERAQTSLDELFPPRNDYNETPGPPIPEWRETPLDQAISTELRRALDDAIQRLPMDYRTVFVLRDIEGHSAMQTARILRMSVPAVKSRLRRARMFLREQLDGYMRS